MLLRTQPSGDQPSDGRMPVRPRAPWEPIAPTADTHMVDGEEAALAELFLALVRSGTPAPLPPPTPTPVDRIWMPRNPGTGLVDDGRFAARHPAFTFGGIKCSERTIGRSPRSSFRGRQGRFHSRKMKRTLWARSDLEFDMFLLCELDTTVEAFIEQPVRVRYSLDGRTRWHTPDLFMLHGGIGEFVAVAAEADAALPDKERRWPAIGATVAASGFGYRVLTERHIRRQPRFTTLRALFADRHASLPDEATRRQLDAALPRDAPTMVSGILARLPHLTVKQIHALIVRGYLATDLDAPLGPDGHVWRGHVPLTMPDTRCA